jgi:flagellar biosynthesis chaperone FliJ
MQALGMIVTAIKGMERVINEHDEIIQEQRNEIAMLKLQVDELRSRNNGSNHRRL